MDRIDVDTMRISKLRDLIGDLADRKWGGQHSVRLTHKRKPPGPFTATLWIWSGPTYEQSRWRRLTAFHSISDWRSALQQMLVFIENAK